MRMIGIRSDAATAALLGRARSLLADDVERWTPDLRERIEGAGCLIIGAAGSIGSVFVKEIVRFRPRAIVLVDPDENELAELVRDLRSSGLDDGVSLRTFSIAMGSVEFDRFLASGNSHDYVVNFAALKHVRAERDPFTLMRMIDVNVLSVRSLLESLAGTGAGRFFSVSSDKAVNPASLMGASKAFMERVMEAYSDRLTVSSSRFANVAFSNGSLPSGFERRLAKGQPLAGPSDVKRFFISSREAAQFCLLSCFLGENRDIYVPRLDPERDMKTFKELAVILLEQYGLKPLFCETEEEARRVMSDRKEDRWPCLFTPSNTSGEKPFEEFVAANENIDVRSYREVGVVKRPAMSAALVERTMTAVDRLVALRSDGQWSKAGIERLIQTVVPTLDHIEVDSDLDSKM